METYSCPRVSDILAPMAARYYEKIPPDILARASERGTEVHAYCQAYLTEDFLPDPNPEIAAYVESFKMAMDTMAYDEIVCLEKRFFTGEPFPFSGQVDLIFRQGNTYTLADIKTSSVYSPMWPVQLGAYAALAKLNDINISSGIIIHVKVKKTKIDENVFDIQTIEPMCYTFKTDELSTVYLKYFKPLLEWHYYLNPKKERKNATGQMGMDSP